MLESSVERKLVRYVMKLGGRAIKLQKTGRRGDVDRILVLPNGIVVFVEVKAPGKKPRPEQLRVLAWLRIKGHYIIVTDGTDLKSVLAYLQKLVTLGTVAVVTPAAKPQLRGVPTSANCVRLPFVSKNIASPNKND